jgi:hypothetical protein
MPYVGFDPKSGCRNWLVESMDAIYVADIGLTGRFATFSFQGLLDGNTWQPPRMVVGPEATGGFAGVVVCAAAVVAGLAVARAPAAAVATADGVAGPGRCGSVPSRTPPAGVGIACPEGPLHALTTSSEHASVKPSRRLGASARSRITAVACPERRRRS